MGVQKYVSEIKYIDHDQQGIYDYLSNFENLSKYVSEDLLLKLSEKIPQVKISDFESDTDSCRFSISGLGQAEIRIIERDPAKTIKINSSGGLPVGITFWIQLLSDSPYKTKMRLTLHADMNMMIKMMIDKKLKQGINQFADMLASLPYK